MCTLCWRERKEAIRDPNNVLESAMFSGLATSDRRRIWLPSSHEWSYYSLQRWHLHWSHLTSKCSMTDSLTSIVYNQSLDIRNNQSYVYNFHFPPFLLFPSSVGSKRMFPYTRKLAVMKMKRLIPWENTLSFMVVSLFYMCKLVIQIEY